MKTIRNIIIYLILFTHIFALMDWRPIHSSFIKYGDWPDKSVDAWWPRWSAFRTIVSKTICPPCVALAEHYYFVLFEIEAGHAEQADLLLKHIPEGSYEGVVSSKGFWWGQGGEDNSNPWKLVSLPAWWLYWLPYTMYWWIAYAGDLFKGKFTWSFRDRETRLLALRFLAWLTLSFFI